MPENEDRRRFFTALGLGYCSYGNHAVLGAYQYGAGSWCPEHLCPSGPIDKPAAGRCQWQGGHWADRIWQLPRDQRFYCSSHLARILRIAMWKP